MRCAVFVDAGYLLAGAGDLYLGASTRSEIGCDYASVCSALVEFAAEHSGDEALRLYWYDAAPNAVPMSDHMTIARLQRVKVRLGRLIGGEQKGVDSLIVRDLMVLARERAISSAYLFGGDEDLREGVVDAQDRAVAVHTLGFPPTGRTRPSDALVRESDEHIELPEALLRPYFSRAYETVRLVPPARVSEIVTARHVVPHTFGEAFGRAWAADEDREGIRSLLVQRPQIPRQLDVQLVMEADRVIGSMREDEQARIELRNGFWEGVSVSWHALNVTGGR